MMLSVGQLKNIIRMLDEGEPRMIDDSLVCVDFLNRDDVVMGSIGGTPIETAYWNIDEKSLSLVIRTEQNVKL